MYSTAMRVETKQIIDTIPDEKIPEILDYLRIFAVRNQIAEKGKKAFLEIRQQAENGNFPDMSIDEINEEISLVRRGK